MAEEQKSSAEVDRAVRPDMPRETADKLMTGMVSPENAEKMFSMMAEGFNKKAAEMDGQLKFSAYDAAVLFQSMIDADEAKMLKAAENMPWLSSEATAEEKLKFMKEMTKVYLDAHKEGKIGSKN